MNLIDPATPLFMKPSFEAFFRFVDREIVEREVLIHCKRVFPINSITNAPYDGLCAADLFGERIPLDRRPVVTGGETVTTADGKTGTYIGVQPQNEAVLRWQWGQFSEADLNFAISWRRAIQSIDLEGMKRSGPKFPFRLNTLPEVAHFVDSMLRNEEQSKLLEMLMDVMQFSAEFRESVRVRWRNGGFDSLRHFSPYGFYCLRVELVFLAGVSNGLLGTKKTNVIDVQYLCYASFAQVFSTGDKFLKNLAPMVLGADQTLVTSDELKHALDELVHRRETTLAPETATSVCGRVDTVCAGI